MTWTAVAALNSARQGLALVTAPAPSPATDLVLYAIGGDKGAGNAQTSWVSTFDPTAPAAWNDSSVTVLSGQVLTGVAAATLAGQVHVIGGTRVGPTVAPINTHHILDPATNIWDAGAAPGLLTTARAYHAAVTGSDGAIYVIGGTDGTSALATVERYDPSTRAWTVLPSHMTNARSGLAAVAVGTTIYAIGGQDSGGTPLAAVELFDTVSRTWSTVAQQPLIHPRTKLAASLGPGGLIYAIGGLSATSPATPAGDVFSWNQSPSSTWQAVSTPVLPPTGAGGLAGALGPDGRLYAVGGNATTGNGLATTAAEVFTSPTVTQQPQPYIGNGTYQSPDIILIDPDTSLPVPLGGQPGGRWDTLLTPNKDYNLSAQIHNDTTVPAPDTIVRFWSFPGGVGTAGTLLSEVLATIAPGGTTVPSPIPFHSATAGHECAVVSLSDAQAPFINVDATSAAQVPDPTVGHPGGTSHYASAWRNTDSGLVMPGHIWQLPFRAETWVREPLPVKIEVTAAKVPLGFEETGQAAKLREDLRVLGATAPTPLFLAPRVRAGLEPAHELEISVSVSEKEEYERLREGEHRELRTSHQEAASFTVRGRIPDDAKPGEVFLVDVAAHHAEGEGHPARTVRWLEVLYVTDRLISDAGRGDR
jgi:N-acetylneuraminic acid mutarotase